MGGEWRQTRLGDVVEIFDGPHATPKKAGGGPIFLGISNLSGGRIDLAETEHLSEEDFARWTRRVTPSPGDVVFSYETRLGEAAMIPHGLAEAHACIESKAHLGAVILSGSVLEGLCLGYGIRSAERLNRAFATKYGRPAPQFHAWKLREWIEVLGFLGDLSPNVEKFGHALRDFRNYVHPAEQLAHRFTPDQHTARIGFQVVAAAIEDLARASGESKEASR